MPPQLVPDEAWVSSDGRVRADIVLWDDSLHIYTFTANESGHGYETAALRELRELAGNRRVIAFAIGDEGSKSYAWRWPRRWVGVRVLHALEPLVQSRLPLGIDLLA